MANEGIMALPQGTGMQGEQPQMRQPQQTVTSAESYDAAQTALGMVNPQEQVALKEALRQNIGDLQLTPQQLEALIQVFEYVSQHPGDYKNLLQKMIQAKVLDEGDMPAEYDPEFIGAMLAVLNEMQQMQAAGAQEPMDLAPTVQGLQPMNMASGGLADVGQYLASKGRGGDSILAHINPKEAAMLKSRGGSGTINPITGLPEFKGGLLGGVFDAIGDAVKGVVNIAKDVLQSPVGRILGTVALATVLGPAGVGLSMGMAGGVAGAGVSLLTGGSMKEALISGAMGYIGGGGTVMGVNPVSAVGRYLPGLAGGALNTGLATGVIGAGIGKLGGMSTEDALKMGLTSGVSAGAMRAIGADDYAVKAKMLTLAEAGDPTALALHDTGDLVKMQSYLDTKSAPVSTAQPTPAGTTAPGAVGPVGSVGTAVENLSFPEAQYGAGNFRSAGNAGTASPAGPPGFFDKMVTGAKGVYNEYLSPSRAGLPSDAGIFQKYGPLAAAGTAAIAAFGGMESSPADESPAFNRNYTGADYIRDNPDLFKGGLSTYTRPTTPNNPIVPASYNTSPVGTPGTTVPKGITRSPGGVAQPYNVAGLYGVPLIYGPDGQPRRMAQGGPAKMTQFPRRDGPINGPGTGTSDDIPAMLSDGEFVFTAKAVRNAGGGSRRKGAARMYKLMKKLEGGAVKGN